MTTSLYEAAVLNQWRLSGDQCNIKALRDAYFEIYFQKHRNKSRYNMPKIIEHLTYQKSNMRLNWYERDEYARKVNALQQFNNAEEQLRSYMYREFSCRPCSNLYKILRKYGRKVPFSNGSWKYDPEYANVNTTPERRESIYFSEFAKIILNDLQTCIDKYNENSRSNPTLWKFSYDKPNSYRYYMSLNCYISTTFMKIPLSITLAKKSIGINLFMSDETEIAFFDNYNPSFYGLTRLMNKLQTTFIQDSICN